MAKKRIKIAKYTKEKHAEASAKFREEQSKIKYGMFSNIVYVLKECRRGARGLFIATIIMLVMELVMKLSATYTDKLVIEFALGTSSRLRLGVICVVLIAVQKLADAFNNAGRLYSSYDDYKSVRNMSWVCLADCRIHTLPVSLSNHLHSATIFIKTQF